MYLSAPAAIVLKEEPKVRVICSKPNIQAGWRRSKPQLDLATLHALSGPLIFSMACENHAEREEQTRSLPGPSLSVTLGVTPDNRGSSRTLIGRSRAVLAARQTTVLSLTTTRPLPSCRAAYAACLRVVGPPGTGLSLRSA